MECQQMFMSANGMSANGMSANGISANGMSSNGMSSNGMSANGMAKLQRGKRLILSTANNIRTMKHWSGIDQTNFETIGRQSKVGVTQRTLVTERQVRPARLLLSLELFLGTTFSSSMQHQDNHGSSVHHHHSISYR